MNEFPLFSEYGMDNETARNVLKKFNEAVEFEMSRKDEIKKEVLKFKEKVAIEEAKKEIVGANMKAELIQR